jgi:hypothetical protein
MRCVCSCEPQLSADDSGAPVAPHPPTHPCPGGHRGL